jgi:chorismate lyase
MVSVMVDSKVEDQIIWSDSFQGEAATISEPMAVWLSKTNKLTQSLDHIVKHWNLDLLHHEALIPTLDEKILLGCADDCFGRVILHKDDEKPLVLGRVIIPQETYDRFSVELNAIGASSIGEKFLFRKKHVLRSPFKYALLSVRSGRISEWVSEGSLALDFVYARTSVFTLEGKYSLLVSEFFLSELPFPLMAD